VSFGVLLTCAASARAGRTVCVTPLLAFHLEWISISA
jgi:hypothetical protein